MICSFVSLSRFLAICALISSLETLLFLAMNAIVFTLVVVLLLMSYISIIV